MWCSYSGDRTPRTRDQDPTLHRLDERHRLVHRLTPALDAPALLASHLALFEIRELPQVVDRVQLAYLHEPGANALHDLPARLEAAPPVCLPLEQISRVQGVGAELEETTQLAGRRGWPEGELLHERGALGVDEGLELRIELGKARVVLDVVKRCMIALVPLVLPDVHCRSPVSTLR